MAKFDLKKAILENKATFFGSLTEGQFSWMTQDTGQQIGSEEENMIPVYMFDDKGKYYYEPNYDGYGVFGGMDYYELLDKMNGGEGDRSRGIDLAFNKEETSTPILFPALITRPSEFDYTTHDFTKEAKHDPNQSWYAAEEDEDFIDQNDEEVYGYDDDDDDDDDADLELQENKPTTKMKMSELKAKIKEMVLAEAELDIQNSSENNSLYDPLAESDFLAEIEGMLNEEDGLTPLQQYIYNYEKDISDERDEEEEQKFLDAIKQLKTPQDVYDYYAYDRDWSGSMDDDLDNIFRQVSKKFKNVSEAKKDEETDTEEVTDDVTDGEETVDVTDDFSMEEPQGPGKIDVTQNANADLTGTKKDVQDNLEAALEAARALGDEKLATQVGNTITFFNKQHVVKDTTVAEGLNESMFPMLKKILK